MRIKTLVIILVAILMVGGLAGGIVYSSSVKKKLEAEIMAKEAEIDSLRFEIDNVGNMVTVYQTAYDVRSGIEIKEEDLQPIEVPEKVADQFIQDPEELVGNYYMIDILGGTPLVSSMVLPFEMTKDMRYLDIILSEVPIGIEVNDYVDIRIAFEDGEDFLSMSNKRVAGVYGKVIKLIVDEKDIHVYESLKVDAACRRVVVDETRKKTKSEFINRIYAIQYFEGGAQADGDRYYPIRKAGTDILLRDPNVEGDLSHIYNEETAAMRKILDKKYSVSSDDIIAYKKELQKVYAASEKDYIKMVEQNYKADLKAAEQAEREAQRKAKQEEAAKKAEENAVAE